MFLPFCTCFTSLLTGCRAAVSLSCWFNTNSVRDQRWLTGSHSDMSCAEVSLTPAFLSPSPCRKCRTSTYVTRTDFPQVHRGGKKRHNITFLHYHPLRQERHCTHVKKKKKAAVTILAAIPAASLPPTQCTSYHLLVVPGFQDNPSLQLSMCSFSQTTRNWEVLQQIHKQSHC